MAIEIFDNEGDYLKINSDGSLTTNSSQDDINTSSRLIETYGTDTYIALAPAGSELSASVWQIQKIDTDGSRQWADGNINFDNAANVALSGLTFSY